MKIFKSIQVLLLSSILLQGCDLIGESNDTAPLIPAPPELVDPNLLVPPADEPVITTDKTSVYDVNFDGSDDYPAISMRGINLDYAVTNPDFFKALGPIADTGANVIRVRVNKETTIDALEAALEQIVANRQAVILSFGGEGITCENNRDDFQDALNNYWLKKFNVVIAQRRFQAHLMINIADRWGPKAIFDGGSKSYGEYIDDYSEAIQKFRAAGFKVPLVIDAPGCGRDVAAFDGGRSATLLAKDSEKNLIFSAHASGEHWDNKEVVNNLTVLQYSGAPYVISGFDGFGVNGDGDIDHNTLLAKSQGDKAVEMDIPWGALDDQFAYVYSPESAFNLLGKTISVDVLLARSLVNDGNTSIDLYVKDSENRFASLGSTSVADLRENGWSTIRFPIGSMNDIKGYVSEGFDPQNIVQVGWQVSANNKAVDKVGKIFFDNFRVDVEPVFKATFDAGLAGFERSWGAGGGADETPLSVSSGEMIIAPVWGVNADDGDGGGGALTQLEVSNYSALAIDMANPFTISVDLYVPEEYSSETLEFKFILKDSEWRYGQVNWVGNADIMRGQYQKISVSISDLSREINYAADGFVFSGAPNAFGFAIAGVTTEKTEAIKIDNFIVSIGDDSAQENIFKLTFDTPEQFDAMMFDFAGGSLSEGTLEMAKKHVFGVLPFSWIANTWFEAEGDRAALSLVDAVDDTGVLTERGEDIVNGEYGIDATSVPIYFPPIVEIER